MNTFIYPGNLKEKKTFFFFRPFDLIVLGILATGSVIYAVQNYSFVPIIFPMTFSILKVRFLDDGTNIWIKLLDVANYMVLSQQTFFWGVRKNAKN